MPFELGVPLDRFDHQVECMDAVDFARHAVGIAWREAEAFGEVEQAIHTSGVEVQHDKHRAGSVFRPREQDEVIGAEVEHGGKDRSGGRNRRNSSPRLGSADVELAGGLLRRVIVTARRMVGPALWFGRRIGILVGLAQAVAAQQKDLGVFDEAIGNGGGDGRIEEDVAPV